MIRFRFVFVLVLIFLPLSNLSIAYGQNGTPTSINYNHLLIEYRLLKGSLTILDSQIANLQESLGEAKKLQENSNKEIASLKGSLTEANKLQENFSNIIADLETQLERAMEQRKALQDRINQLENELTELTISLENMKAEIAGNESKHEKAVFDIVTAYESKQSSLEMQRNIFVGVVIIETLAIGILSYLISQ